MKMFKFKNILEKKNDSEKLELLDDHLKELEEMDRMKKIEFLNELLKIWMKIPFRNLLS